MFRMKIVLAVLPFCASLRSTCVKPVAVEAQEEKSDRELSRYTAQLPKELSKVPERQASNHDEFHWRNNRGVWEDCSYEVYDDHAKKLIQRNLCVIFPAGTIQQDTKFSAIQIGRGTFGIVYAVQVSSSKIVKAVKIGFNDCGNDFHQEVVWHALATSDTITSEERELAENGIQKMDMFSDRRSKIQFLVSDYLGTSLDSIAKDFLPRLSLSDRLDVTYHYAKQLLDILGVLHKLSFTIKGETVMFVHRDIKLQNIVVNESTHKLSLVDFGLASGKGRCYPMTTWWFESPQFYDDADMWDAFHENRDSPTAHKPTAQDDVWAAGVTIGMLLGEEPKGPLLVGTKGNGHDDLPELYGYPENTSEFDVQDRRQKEKHFQKWITNHLVISPLYPCEKTIAKVLEESSRDGVKNYRKKWHVLRNVVESILVFDINKRAGCDVFRKLKNKEYNLAKLKSTQDAQMVQDLAGSDWKKHYKESLKLFYYSNAETDHQVWANSSNSFLDRPAEESPKVQENVLVENPAKQNIVNKKTFFNFNRKNKPKLFNNTSKIEKDNQAHKENDDNLVYYSAYV